MKSFDKTLNKTRRDFLAMLTKAGVSSTLLKSSALASGVFASRFAAAQGQIKRAVFVYTPDGAPNNYWLPNGNNLKPATLAYEGLQSICNFREVDIVRSGHGNSRKSLGALKYNKDWRGDTIDQQIASVISPLMPYESFFLGVQTTNDRLVSRKSGAAVAPQNSPATAYQQLFGSAPPAGDAQAYLARKQSVLDVNRNALNRLKNKFGQFEREKIEKHEQTLNDLEQRLIDTSTVELPSGCSSPAWNANGYDTQGPIPGGDVGIFAHQSDLQSDIITAAFECGLTNVMTLQLGTDQANWLGHDTVYKGDHHGSCHAASVEENAEMTNYLSRCVAYLIHQLKDRDDPDVPGTKLIDNTIVVQVTDMGSGRDHTAGNGPNMIATRMSSFKQGTVTTGGNNLQVLEAVVEGLGLSAYKGENVDVHKIWPCGEGIIADGLLS